MIDVVMQEIELGHVNNSNISFDKIRSVAGIDYGDNVWTSLGRGQRTLASQEQLNQYLYSYGLMVKNQWEKLFQKTSVFIDSDSFSIFDYGCGQGLASVMFLDNVRIENKKLEKITLIEPSAIALKRAESITACYCPNTSICAINEKIDTLKPIDLSNNNKTTFHLFSNILDINSFNHISLFDKILSHKGVHYILAVSHDREFQGGSPRLRDVYSKVLDNQIDNNVRVTSSMLDTFTCNRGQKVISFFIKVEV